MRCSNSNDGLNRKIEKGGNFMVYYDITNPNASYSWLCETLHITEGELTRNYIIECHSDPDEFFEKYQTVIKKIDIENLEVIAFQVTSNDNECGDIKRNGLHNLQWALSNETVLNRYLKNNKIKFDIENKLLYIDGDRYDIAYGKYKDLDLISEKEEQLNNVGHKIYYDFQINAFLFCEDIYDYSCICKTPEFLFTLSKINRQAEKIYETWKNNCEAYVVKFKAKLKWFDYYTFYDSKIEYEEDIQENWFRLRKKLVSRALDSMMGNSASEICAYMKPDIAITPENIIEYVPAKEWRKNVLKYFGKE